MSFKVFISYSHKDECYKDALLEHMSGLKRSGLISEWNDRKIIPGQDWETEISDNLSSSNLILFLVSSSFMNSDYCIGVEVDKALKMHREGSAQLIPIVIRSVDWSDSPLSKLQGLPKDAKAISSWGDQDEAWVNVINGLKSHIKDFKPKKLPDQIRGGKHLVQLTGQMIEWLEDTEIVLTHRKVNKITFSDIYTVPDIELISTEDDGELRKFRNADGLTDQVNRMIFSGEEQQGKTSLLKYYYKDLLKKEFLPIYIEGSKIKNSRIEEVLKKELSRQYVGVTLDFFNNHSGKILLVDNIDEISLNKRYRDLFFGSVNDIFERYH